MKTMRRIWTQQTFYIWAAKGHQLQDRSKAKSWLYTTLHREFLAGQRRQHRFRHYELTEVSSELPSIDPALVNRLELPDTAGLPVADGPALSSACGSLLFGRLCL
jgi:DNA-directed RNA polymerase specialized sigma24 family protein